MSRRFDRKLTTALFFLIAAASAFAADGRRSHFMSSGPGAAAAALGESLSAKGYDASAVFYNPATLSGQESSVLFQLENPNIGAHRSWLVTALGNKNIKTGFAWAHDQLPLESRRDGVVLGLGVSEKALPMIPLPKNTSLGINLGYVDMKIAEYSATSFFADVGGAWSARSGLYDFGLGAMVKNLYFSGLQYRDAGEKERWPRELRTGLFITRNFVTLLAGANSVDSKISPTLGFEVSPMKLLHLRLGVNNGMRYGVGVELTNLLLDFNYKIGELTNAPALSLSYKWGKPINTDYTDPYNEVEARMNGLEGYFVRRVQDSLHNEGEIPRVDVLKLLIVSPGNETAWTLLNATGDSRIKAKLPSSKKARQSYMQFAVAFSYDEPESKEFASSFITRFPKESIIRIMNFVFADIERLNKLQEENNARDVDNKSKKDDRPHHRGVVPGGR